MILLKYLSRCLLLDYLCLTCITFGLIVFMVSGANIPEGTQECFLFDAIPSAVPIVTKKESNQLNIEAIEHAKKQKERREPFYNLYDNTKIDSIPLEGTIRAISTIPNPANNDYDNCLYALFLEIESILTNRPIDNLSKEIIINVPIMKDKTIIDENIFYPGDKVFVLGSEYSQMPQDIQEIQLSDDIQSFEHQCYYVLTIHKISSFSHSGRNTFATREITIQPIQRFPKDNNAVKLRKERIQKEILRIEKELKTHGGSFEEWKKSYKPIAEKYSRLCENGFRGWIKDSFYAAVGPETNSYDTKKYISGILPYKQYLEKNNIDLIVVRIPSKWDFAARVLASDDFQDNPVWIEHYYECLKNDIEIVDPMYEMWKERFEHPLFYFYQKDDESHPFEGMYLPTAKFLSDILSRYVISKDEAFTLGDAEFESPAYKDEKWYYPAGNSKFNYGNQQHHLSFKCLLWKNERIGKLKTYGGSPVLCLSNSYFGFPDMQDQGASLPHYLSYYLEHIVDWKYQNGMGNIMLRNLVSDRNALNKRKVVLMVGAWNAFAGGFSDFPKYISENASKIVLIKSIPSIDLDFNNNECVCIKENGVVTIKPKQKNIILHLDIPPMKDYKGCMIRLNFPICNCYIQTTANDSDNKQMDRSDLTVGKDIRNDLYIPASSLSQEVNVVLTPSSVDSFCFGISNIEIWGF